MSRVKNLEGYQKVLGLSGTLDEASKIILNGGQREFMICELNPPLKLNQLTP